MLVQRVLILLWKYLLVKEEELFCWWKVSKFLLAALFANARILMLANFGLKIRPFWDSDHENWYSYFSRKQNTFCENNLHQITYLPKSYLWTKNEGNRFFNSCHSMVDISWPSLLNCFVKDKQTLETEDTLYKLSLLKEKYIISVYLWCMKGESLSSKFPRVQADDKLGLSF